MMLKAFVNCDWGTTRLRLRAVQLAPWQITTEYRSQDGVASIAQSHGENRPQAFRSLLTDGLRPLVAEQPRLLAAAPILISGMASSSIGWRELPYAELPMALDGNSLTFQELDPIESELGKHSVVLISGVRSPTDIMRGEETEIVGLFSLPLATPLLAQSLVIKPGTHSKHLRVQDGQVLDFQTFMTGELFELLSAHSILQHSVTAAGAESSVDVGTLENMAEFRAGVLASSQRTLAAALFRVRTRQVLDAAPAAANRAYLSGVLLGAELAYLRSLDASLPLVLCASEPLHGAYRAALDALELTERTTLVPAEETEMLSARGQAVLARRVLQR